MIVGAGGGGPGGGLGTLLLALLVAFLGGDPSGVFQPGVEVSPDDNVPQVSQVESDRSADFVSAVQGETEDTWQSIFRTEFGAPYQEPSLVLYSGATQSAGSAARSAMGPFYCPADQKNYLNMSFLRDLAGRHGAPGEFAHGSSQQRAEWFYRSIENGSIDPCNTFDQARV